jgi:hypothetical protein
MKTILLLSQLRRRIISELERSKSGFNRRGRISLRSSEFVRIRQHAAIRVVHIDRGQANITPLQWILREMRERVRKTHCAYML